MIWNLTRNEVVTDVIEWILNKLKNQDFCSSPQEMLNQQSGRIWNDLEQSDGHSPGSYKSCLVWKSSTQLMEPVETVANVVWVMYVVAWWRGVGGVRGGDSWISREAEALTRRRAGGRRTTTTTTTIFQTTS